MKNGWLVNDRLTCIPETKTFWHNLLEWIPNLEDMTDTYTEYSVLAEKIENRLCQYKPEYIIRNASYFRKINTNVKTISLVQDIIPNDNMQNDVCNNSDVVVFNTNYCKNHYDIKTKSEIIPLGVDFNFFDRIENKKEIRKKYGISKNTILYIGSSLDFPKGFNKVLELIDSLPYNFCLVMKDNYSLNNDKVKTFNRINHTTLKEIINCCSLGICTSIVETQHLAGIEICACDIPMVTTNVGIYSDLKHINSWGMVSNIKNFKDSIQFVLENKKDFSPRKCFLDSELDLNSCREKWKSLINNI